MHRIPSIITQMKKEFKKIAMYFPALAGAQLYHYPALAAAFIFILLGLIKI